MIYGYFIIARYDHILKLGLNMFLVPQVSVKFAISPSSKLLTNLVIYL